MKSKEIVSKGHQAFNVPNTPEGIAFLQQAKKYAHSVRLHSRGRGKRIHDGHIYFASLPVDKAEWIALYADGVGTLCYRDFAAKAAQLKWDNEDLTSKLKKAQADLSAALQANKSLAAHLNEVQDENIENIQKLAEAKGECNDLTDRINRLHIQLNPINPASIPVAPVVPVIVDKGKEIVIRISVG
jgi:hypothetical protein